MSINSIGSTLYNSELLNGTNKKEDESLLDQLANQKSGQATDESALSPGRRLLQSASGASEALAEMKKNGVPVNLQNVDQEIQKKEAEFQLLVATSLKALGIDEDIEFKIALDENGNIIVNSSHEEKDKVQNFFDNNPELTDVFKGIESLKNLQKNMQNSRSTDTASIKRSVQMENMNAYFQGIEQGQDAYGPLILAYSKTSILAMAGINMNV